MSQRITFEGKITISEDDATLSPAGRVFKTLEWSKTWEDGTNDNQANRYYLVEGGSVVAGTPQDLDLQGSLTRRLQGTAMVIDEVAAIFLIHKSGTGSLRLGTNAAAVLLMNAAASYFIVPPGGVLQVYSADSSWAVTATAADIIELISTSGTITYDMLIVGRKN